MGFMEPHRISTTLILEADDAISSLYTQAEDCFSLSPVRRLFLCGDDIIAEGMLTPTHFLVHVCVGPALTFDPHGVLTRIVRAGLGSQRISRRDAFQN